MLIERHLLSPQFTRKKISDSSLPEVEQDLCRFFYLSKTAHPIDGERKISSLSKQIIKDRLQTSFIRIQGERWNGRTKTAAILYRILQNEYENSRVFPIYINFDRLSNLKKDEEIKIFEQILESDLSFLSKGDKIALFFTRFSPSVLSTEASKKIKRFIKENRNKISLITCGFESSSTYKPFSELVGDSLIYDHEYEITVRPIPRGSLTKSLDATFFEKYPRTLKEIKRLNPPMLHGEIYEELVCDEEISKELKEHKSWYDYIFHRARQIIILHGYDSENVISKILLELGRKAFSEEQISYINKFEWDRSLGIEKTILEKIYSRLSSQADCHMVLLVNYYCTTINSYDRNKNIRKEEVENIFSLCAPFDSIYNEYFKHRLNSEDLSITSASMLEKLQQIYSHLYAKIKRVKSKDKKNIFFNGLAHCCYLLGRFNVQPNINQAIKFLTDIESKFNECELNSSFMPSKEYRLFKRSVYISLAYLEDAGASDKFRDIYLETLFADAKEDQLNADFHIEYYGKCAKNPENDESLSSAAIRLLWNRVVDSLEGQIPKLLSIQIYTVFSLILNEYQNQETDSHIKEKIKSSAIEKSKYLINKNGIINDKRIRGLAKFILIFFENNLTANEFLLWLLDRFKHLPRQGWLDRNLDKQASIESVASHTYSAQFLARILINEEHASIGIKKEKVIQLLWAHDFPEAIVGDRVNKTEVDREQEMEVAWVISCFGLIRGLSRDLTTIGPLVSEFEAGETPSAKAAQAIDKIENSIQLINYGRTIDFNTLDLNKDQGYEKFMAKLRRGMDNSLSNTFNELIADMQPRINYKGPNKNIVSQFENVRMQIFDVCNTE